MTRIIRINSCDGCPHGTGGDGTRGCRATIWCDEGGLRIRRFSGDYPSTPDWCPLEEVQP